MLVIIGRRFARIGRFIDTDHICYPCKAYDREVLVQRPYFHFCFIPVFPIGRNEYSVRCRNCGDETLSDSIVKKYQARVKTPFYLYSAWILVGCITLIWFYWNSITTKHKIEYIEKPAIGDVYLISKNESDGARYYFVRIMEVNKDSVRAFRNNLDYGGFVSSFSYDDYFVKDDTLYFSKKQLKRLLADDDIISIERGYSEGSDFNRFK